MPMHSRTIKFLDLLAKEYKLDWHKSEDFVKLLMILSEPGTSEKYNELLSIATATAKDTTE